MASSALHRGSAHQGLHIPWQPNQEPAWPDALPGKVHARCTSVYVVQHDCAAAGRHNHLNNTAAMISDAAAHGRHPGLFLRGTREPHHCRPWLLGQHSHLLALQACTSSQVPASNAVFPRDVRPCKPHTCWPAAGRHRQSTPTTPATNSDAAAHGHQAECSCAETMSCTIAGHGWLGRLSAKQGRESKQGYGSLTELQPAVHH
jgi:hypothetical protein